MNPGSRAGNVPGREHLIWARAESLGLVAALGFLVVVSLIVSTALTAFGTHTRSYQKHGNEEEGRIVSFVTEVRP
jgi:hypothetical protein